MRPEPWPGPQTIVSATLANGLRVWVYENHESATVALDATLWGGSVHEPPTQAGLANLTARLLRRGTLRLSYDALNEILDGLAASLGFSCGRHATGFEAYCLAEDFPTVLALAVECLLEPAFAPDQFALVQAQILAEHRQRRYNTGAQAWRGFREAVFGDHAYGRPISGGEDTVSGLTPQDVEAFYRRTIGPQGGVLVIVGAVRADEAIQQVEALLGGWNPSVSLDDPEPPSPMSASAPLVTRVTLDDKSQSDLVLGWLGPSRRHPDFFPTRVANAILGEFGLGGRLGANVRERRGLAYAIGSDLETNLQAGTWSVSAGVHPAHVEQAVAAILDECERMRQEPVEPAELADVQAYLTGSLPIRLETNAQIADYLGAMAWYDLGMDYLLRYREFVYAVGREDVLRMAQTYLNPERYVLAVAGP
ncbi:MAG: insulinase family protein [Caldilineales bacterium]|nr:insulinase family protein [Caldilineales bacterium]